MRGKLFRVLLEIMEGTAREEAVMLRFKHIHRRFDYVIRLFLVFFFRRLDEEKGTCDLNFETSFRLKGLVVISPTPALEK